MRLLYDFGGSPTPILGEPRNRMITQASTGADDADGFDGHTLSHFELAVNSASLVAQEFNAGLRRRGFRAIRLISALATRRATSFSPAPRAGVEADLCRPLTRSFAAAATPRMPRAIKKDGECVSQEFLDYA